MTKEVFLIPCYTAFYHTVSIGILYNVAFDAEIMINTHLLKFEVGPAQYKSLAISKLYTKDPSQRYWDILPYYLIARCPLCGSEYTARLDTYSLLRWRHAVHGANIFEKEYENIGCQHFVMAHHFINLNGKVPSEVHYFENISEVPYVVPRLLVDKLQSGTPDLESEDLNPQAVMHALPICRIENRQFVPSYSVYMITYYALNPAPLIAHYHKLRDYIEWFPEPVLDDADRELWWDLEYWIKMKKFWWLNPNDPELPLQNTLETFPYRNIQGIRSGRTYRHD